MPGGTATIRGLVDHQSEVYDIPELRDLLLPALRADYRLIEAYRPDRPLPLRTPITAYTSRDDSSRPLQDVRARADLTEPGRFDLRTFPGDHFYLVPHEAELLADIGERLVRDRPARPPEPPPRSRPEGRCQWWEAG
ncbi:thioesterase II family protein [Streptomyces phaeoluteigriseus]|uniref:thioesterase II family protein n=1 Tax=Streptomyces phaeoluteigriseus TaxID=114686 RepID=UPI0036CE3BB4